MNNEYIKIDPNTDVTWENLGDILCEHTVAMIANRKSKELRNKTELLRLSMNQRYRIRHL